MTRKPKLHSQPVRKFMDSWCLPESRLREIAEHAEAIRRLAVPRAALFQVNEESARKHLAGPKRDADR